MTENTQSFVPGQEGEQELVNGQPVDAEKLKVDEERAKRDAKCEVVAEQVLQIIAKHKPPAKDLSANHDDMLKFFGPIHLELMELFLEQEMTIGEVNYMWTIVQSVMDQAKSLNNLSIQDCFDRGQRKLWDVVDMSDLTLNKIDSILKAS